MKLLDYLTVKSAAYGIGIGPLDPAYNFIKDPRNPYSAYKFDTQDPVRRGLDSAMYELGLDDKSNLVYGKPRTNKLWSAARLLVPGASTLAELLNLKDAVKLNKERVSTALSPSNWIKPDAHPDPKGWLDSYTKLQDHMMPKIVKGILLKHGIPDAAGIGGALIGLTHAHLKNKKDAKEYNDIVNSEEFKSLPKDVQKRILKETGLYKKKRGIVGRALRDLKYGVGYGAAARVAALYPAYKAYKKYDDELIHYTGHDPSYRDTLLNYEKANGFVRHTPWHIYRPDPDESVVPGNKPKAFLMGGWLYPERKRYNHFYPYLRGKPVPIFKDDGKRIKRYVRDTDDSWFMTRSGPGDEDKLEKAIKRELAKEHISDKAFGKIPDDIIARLGKSWEEGRPNFDEVKEFGKLYEDVRASRDTDPNRRKELTPEQKKLKEKYGL